MQNGILYLQRLRQLLQMEYDNDLAEYQQQLERSNMKRNISRGICWYPVTLGRSYYNSLNQLVVEVMREHKEDGREATAFEYGKAVQFFAFAGTYRNDILKDKGNVKYYQFRSTVSFVDGDMMVVTLPSSQQLVEIQSVTFLGVQLYFDETSYRTMFNALESVMKTKDNRLAELRDICAGQQAAAFRHLAPMTFPWLNKSQEEAVNKVLAAKDVMIVHGPPGTGKTTTLVEAIYETLRRETQVMVCAQSNMAVDWISEKLVDHGVPVLRIGNPTRVNEKMLSFTYEKRFEAHPDYPDLWNLRRAIRQLYEARKGGENMHQKIARLRERAEELEMRIREDLFSQARVIACTLVGSANKVLVNQRFSTLFIDEAAQALEPACWIAMRRCSRVVLAGDHQQLPPTIKSFDALRQGLGKTLMERIVENQPTAVSLLRVQYRMNDTIMRFSSDWFYGGQLESDPSVHFRSILDYDIAITWVDGKEETSKTPPQPSPAGEGEDLLPLVDKSDSSITGDFLPLSHKPDSSITNNNTPSHAGEGRGGVIFSEEFISETNGRLNKAEAELLISTLANFINRIGRQRFIDERLDIGIISPYKVQTQYLRTLIRQHELLRQFRKVISIDTVDGFQGQERDIMLISLVRSNEDGQIGFLRDLRRMNVAMTRARMKLFIFGDKSTLRHHAFYRKLIEYEESLKETVD